MHVVDVKLFNTFRSVENEEEFLHLICGNIFYKKKRKSEPFTTFAYSNMCGWGGKDIFLKFYMHYKVFHGAY